MTITHIQKLVSLGSEPLARMPVDMPELLKSFALGPEVFAMLQSKNGFYAFESALHVFSLAAETETGLEAWNAASLWRQGYQDLAEGLLFFAEDILQDQFCLSAIRSGVLRFHAETGETSFMAESIEEWASVILSDYPSETGWPFASEWQARNGPLQPGQRLMPKTPFFLGGEYDLQNFWAGNSVEGMRLKADLAMQTRLLPEGATVKLHTTPHPGV